MRITRIIFIILALAIIIAQLSILDYDNLGGRPNLGNYLSIAGMVLLIIAMIVSHIESRRSE